MQSKTEFQKAKNQRQSLQSICTGCRLILIQFGKFQTITKFRLLKTLPKRSAANTKEENAVPWVIFRFCRSTETKSSPPRAGARSESAKKNSEKRQSFWQPRRETRLLITSIPKSDTTTECQIFRPASEEDRWKC